MEAAQRRRLVLDTNVVLDLLVFDDPRVADLRATLESGAGDWLITPPMRDEFERVLAYPRIARHLRSRGFCIDALLLRFDRLSHVRTVAARSPVHCNDTDDQMFIDLAVAHRADLLSKDLAVLRLRKRLAILGVSVGPPADAPLVGQARAVDRLSAFSGG